MAQPRGWCLALAVSLNFLKPGCRFVLGRLHSPCSPGAHRSQRAAPSWRGSGPGPRWHWSRNAAGWSWRSPVGGCTCRHRGVRSSVRATAPIPPCHHGRVLTGSPECTSHSRRRLRPHSPRRWDAPHMLQPSLGPPEGRRVPAEQGSQPPPPPEVLGEGMLGRRGLLEAWGPRQE